MLGLERWLLSFSSIDLLRSNFDSLLELTPLAPFGIMSVLSTWAYPAWPMTTI
jgi:hypothetical protein